MKKNIMVFVIACILILILSACNLPLTNTIETPSSSIVTVRVENPTELRSGPGLVYDPVGTLNPGEEVVVVGRSLDGTYLLIQNPSDPSALGWLKNESLMLKNDPIGLPVFSPPATPTAVNSPAEINGCPTPIGGGPTPVSCSNEPSPAGGCPTPIGGGPTPVSCSNEPAPAGGCPTPIGGGPTPVSCSNEPVSTGGCPTPIGGGPTPISCSNEPASPGSGCPTPIGGGPTPVSCSNEPPSAGSGCPTPIGGGPTPISCSPSGRKPLPPVRRINTPTPIH